MKKYYIFLFLTLIVPRIGLAQKGAVENHIGNRVNITKIKIKDPVLIRHVTQFIEKQLSEDSLFRTKGYIRISPINANLKPNVVGGYHINKNFMSFDDIANDKQFPMFYSFLSDKIILFLNYDLGEIFEIKYTKRSKVKFRKDIEPYLFKAQTIVFRDEDNKKQRFENFREDEFFHVGGGINVYIMNDGKIVVDP